MSKFFEKKGKQIRNIAGQALEKAYPGYAWVLAANVFEDKDGEYCQLCIYNLHISQKEGFVYNLDGYNNDPMEIERLAMLAGGQILEMANLPRGGLDEKFLLAKRDENGKIIVSK